MIVIIMPHLFVNKANNHLSRLMQETQGSGGRDAPHWMSPVS